MHNTYKFATDHFVSLAKSAHFEPVHREMSESGRIALHVLKAV